MKVFGIPLRIDPSFYLVTALVALMGERTAQGVVSWVVAVFVSILVHELGHALVAERFGFRTSMVLHGFGGTTFRGGGMGRTTVWREVAISLAGPGAGFVLGALAFAAQLFMGTALEGIRMLTSDILWCCVAWGVLNLFPMLPLDGGNVARALCARFFPYSLRLPWIISVTTGVLSGLMALWLGMFFWVYISGRAVYEGVVAIRGLPSVVAPKAKRTPTGTTVPFRPRSAGPTLAPAPAPAAGADEDSMRAARAAFIREPDAGNGTELVMVFARARRFSALAAIAAGADGAVIPAAALLGAAEAALAGGVPKSAIEIGELAFRRGGGGNAAALIARAHGRLGAKEEAVRWVRTALAAGIPAASLRAAPELAALGEDSAWSGGVN